MGIVRRGRKPKLQVQEAGEEVLNFDSEDEPLTRKGNDAADPPPEEIDEDGDGTGGKAVVVRARPRRTSAYRESRVRPDGRIGAEAAAGISADSRFADSPGHPSQEPAPRYTPQAEESLQPAPANDNSWQGPAYSRPRSPRPSSFSGGTSNGRAESAARGFGEGSGPAAYVPNHPAPISLPKNLPPMPDIYGKPEPRSDQDNGKPRLSINELIRL
ncbi:MAG: hypothetical protein LBR93_04990, partial [Treponema sp.]|nr:hypothetical protein [Treponema sp.]